MSTNLQFRLTAAGQQAAWNTNNTGLSLELTHVQFGSGNRSPNGTETALTTPQKYVAIAAGSRVAPNQIRLSAILSGADSFNIAEIGVWKGVPGQAGSVLFAYWSQPSGNLAAKAPGVDFIFSHDMVLSDAVAAGSVTIVADNSQSAMLAMLSAHEAKADPHPIYLTQAEADARYINTGQIDSLATDAEVSSQVAAHAAAPDAHSHYAKITNVQSATHITATAVGGTVNAITATFTPAITSPGDATLYIVSSGANTNTTVTLKIDDLAAAQLVKGAGEALAVGDTGAAGYIMHVKRRADGKYALLNPCVGMQIGVGQSWQDVTASRALGVTYYNTTGRPIGLVVGAQTTGTGGAVRITVNGVEFPATYSYNGNAPAASATAIVPPGHSYSAAITNGTGTYNKWLELR